MDDQLVSLGEISARLSSALYELEEKCKHDAVSAEISTVADELARMSTTLWQLHKTTSAAPDQYTPAFKDDLHEILGELNLLFDEINGCCADMQKIDAENRIPWLFKKSRVFHFFKYLEALKSTLVVMRIVLGHGKDVGTHRYEVVKPPFLRLILSLQSCSRPLRIQSTYSATGTCHPREPLRPQSESNS